MLIAGRGHAALTAGQPLEREQLYGLTFVSLNQGSSVQAAQATMLRRHGLSWRRLKIDMVRCPACRRMQRHTDKGCECHLQNVAHGFGTTCKLRSVSHAEYRRAPGTPSVLNAMHLCNN